MNSSFRFFDLFFQCVSKCNKNEFTIKPSTLQIVTHFPTYWETRVPLNSTLYKRKPFCHIWFSTFKTTMQLSCCLLDGINMRDNTKTYNEISNDISLLKYELVFRLIC